MPTTKDVELTKDIVQMATNGHYSAAVMKNGDLYTWGAQTVATEGGGWSIPSKETEYKNPAIFAHNVSKVFLGAPLNGYIDNNGDLYMWGSNMGSKIGPYVQDKLEGTAYTPYKVDIPGKVKKVSENGNLTGAVLENGDAYMWGTLSYEEQSTFGADSVDQGVPVKIAENVQDLQINRGVRSYLTTDGDLYTWGNNGNKELGRETEETTDYTPTKIPELSDITSYQLNSTSFALKSDGTLYGWGNNWDGTVGNGTQTTVITPVQVLDQVQSIVATEKDDFVTVSGAIKKDKSLWLWGRNNPFTIGNGNSTDSVLSPEKILDSVTTAVSVTGISFATCEDGSLWGWGWNDRKVIGDFTTEERPYPIVVTLYGTSPSVKMTQQIIHQMVTMLAL